MNFRVEELPSCRIAYIRRIGAYGINNVEIMKNLKRWVKAKNLYNEKSIILAIVHDNPQIIKEEDCRYDACIIISNDYKIDYDENVKESDVLGGKYAIFQVDHTEEELQKAWTEIFPELQNQNFRLDIGKPIVERYQVSKVNKQNFYNRHKERLQYE